MEKIIEWAERNPWLAGGLVFGVGLLLLWMLGYIGGGSSQQASNNGQATAQTNLAAAYYAAEAAQATAGTQLQLAQVNDTAAVNIATASDNAQVAMDAADNAGQSSVATIYAGLGTTEANDAMQTSQLAYNDNLNAANTASADALSEAEAYDTAQQAVESGYYGDQNQLGNAYINYLTAALPYEFAQSTTPAATSPAATATQPTIAPITNTFQPQVIVNNQPMAQGYEVANFDGQTYVWNPAEYQPGNDMGSQTSVPGNLIDAYGTPVPANVYW